MRTRETPRARRSLQALAIFPSRRVRCLSFPDGGGVPIRESARSGVSVAGALRVRPRRVGRMAARAPGSPGALPGAGAALSGELRGHLAALRVPA